jgi:hypothetical protein
MKLLYHIKIYRDDKVCVYKFPHRIRYFSAFVNDKVYAVLEDGSLHFCEKSYDFEENSKEFLSK